MKIRSPFYIIILSLSILLSACSHTDKNLDSGPVITTSPSIEQTDQNNHSKGSDTNVTTVKVTALKYTNLLDRIRDGFGLPEYSSKHTSQNEKWSSRHNTYLTNLLARAEPFLYQIVEEIDKRDIPMEIALLPAVESAFKPNAISSSKAGGIWQFIPSTARYLGLRQDWWFDERREIISSTNTALDYLTHLNKEFDGDWFLAIAAYNAGKGTIRRAIKANKRKHRKTDYRSLDLRQETRRYVPKLIALRNIIRDPKKFNVKLPAIPNRPYFQAVSFTGQININQFADSAKIDIAELRHLNAGFLRWATPPNGPFRLLIPNKNVPQAKLALSQLAKQSLIEIKQHRVNRGETLGGIATKYGVSVSTLKSHNGLKSSTIRAGSVLMIPLHQLSRHHKSTERSAQQASSSGKTHTHRVSRGDTLWSIARRYNVHVKQLLAWNNLSKNQTLHLGQRISVLR